MAPPEAQLHPAVGVSDKVHNIGREAPQPIQPGKEAGMKVQPHWIRDDYRGSGKLSGKVALITGGDSGIGRSAAVHYAREGAVGIAVVYKGDPEHKDAEETSNMIRNEGCRCITIAADVGDPEACQKAVDWTLKEFGRLDVLVNNAAEQHVLGSIMDISNEQLHRTFATNIFSMFYLAKAALPHLQAGSCIINSTSVLAYKGKPDLLDYSTTKGAIVTFTRSLSEQLAEKNIRVNAVAPGPIWTPLIPTTMGEEQGLNHGKGTPMKRMGQPSENGPAYVFLASDIDSSYITGQTIHVNGGDFVSS